MLHTRSVVVIVMTQWRTPEMDKGGGGCNHQRGPNVSPEGPKSTCKIKKKLTNYFFKVASYLFRNFFLFLEGPSNPQGGEQLLPPPPLGTPL